ncbi:glucose-6-P dehydrogenase subunit [Bifidobacterium actinocoloniiforme DSM 22766]|uniref:Glucose-6-P dehydrogenase subunit n=1 Tax=Bifidobacterium actinocoloniiforme DSM 22766 TaxID=1437605 RepID=A0A086YYF6_9BIFI|nr:glucose-6-phosphate dehydrogenase assembly protein OpcA [Bifidobacterium actinocoloniiforme]AKV55856.1 OpcA protein [Bifidobacterium actinocoloniiforme DSM 22766]KFI39306.1 glucose-6-P dehydrogenase subunit [Bifidobacterium actinocoloniiforme DSM 22766]
MIVAMPNTTTAAIAHEIDEMHVERGEAGMDRVLTLIISTCQADLEQALEAVNAASREHPCRVIAIVTDGKGEGSAWTPDPGPDHDCFTSVPPADQQERTLDAQIRFGADAGAGEVIVLAPVDGLLKHLDALVIPLLVPDVPIVTWWPNQAPSNPSDDPVGSKSSSRITDAQNASDPPAAFEQLREHCQPDDIDLSWTRITIWRAMLASMLDQPPHLPVQSVRVSGQTNYLPLELLASWLALKLGVPVSVDRDPAAQAITGVYFEREDGQLSMERFKSDHAVIRQPGQADQTVSLPLRTTVDCLGEELGRLDPDEVYAEVVSTGWGLVDHR